MIDLYGNKVEEKVEEEFKPRRVGLFDWLEDLNNGKKGLFDHSTERDFSPFIINRGMSQNIETIMYANEMNKCWHLTKEMVHDFYLYAVPKKKRYGKWAKQSNDEKDIIDLIIKHYKVGRARALEYRKLLTDSDINALKEKYEVGGKM